MALLAERRDQLATVQATLHLTDNAFAEERTRNRELLNTHRADLAERDAAAAAQRTEHEAAPGRLCDDAAGGAHRREAEPEQVRAEHTARREQLITDHATQLAALPRGLGAAHHELELLRRELAEASTHEAGPPNS